MSVVVPFVALKPKVTKVSSAKVDFVVSEMLHSCSSLASVTPEITALPSANKNPIMLKMLERFQGLLQMFLSIQQEHPFDLHQMLILVSNQMLSPAVVERRSHVYLESKHRHFLLLL